MDIIILRSKIVFIPHLGVGVDEGWKMELATEPAELFLD